MQSQQKRGALRWRLISGLVWSKTQIFELNFNKTMARFTKDSWGFPWICHESDTNGSEFHAISIRIFSIFWQGEKGGSDPSFDSSHSLYTEIIIERFMESKFAERKSFSTRERERKRNSRRIKRSICLTFFLKARMTNLSNYSFQIKN